MTTDVREGRPSRPRRSDPGVRAGNTPINTTYTVEIGGKQLSVTLTGDGVLLDGVEVTAAVVQVPSSPIQMLWLGDSVHELVAHRAEHRGAFTISLDDQRVDVEALDERARAVRSLRAAAGASAGVEPVRAPMPGLVTRILVSPGEEVKAGARLVVMEAMKMENELRAKADGRVRLVAVAPGTAVEKGALLVEWETGAARPSESSQSESGK
jgi:biotin carboxyl carrier protein